MHSDPVGQKQEKVDLDVRLGSCLDISVNVWFGVPVVFGYLMNLT